MSRLLLSKLSPIIEKRSNSIRWYTSLKGPYGWLGMSGKEKLGQVLLFDASKEEIVEVTSNTTIQQEKLVWDHHQVLGASKGLVVLLDPQDRSLIITSLLSCQKNPKLFTLPPLTPLLSCQTNVVWNVAMSSCPDDNDDDDDYVVGIKSLGDQLSFCRPHLDDLCWTKISTPFDHFPTSNLMYSKRDKRFCLLGPGGHHFLSYDLVDIFNKKHHHHHEFHELHFRDIPKSLAYVSDEMLPYTLRTEHLVESPSGDERFLVKCYAKCCCLGDDDEKSLSYETQMLMVFREEETLDGKYTMCYTEDIGDMCIFISKSDAFCVKATSFPGLTPNSIYFIGFEFGIYHLSTRTISTFYVPTKSNASSDFLLDRICSMPYWFPPFST
ncbi:unnamed protein product [Cochlearia groenlandica]